MARQRKLKAGCEHSTPPCNDCAKARTLRREQRRRYVESHPEARTHNTRHDKTDSLEQLLVRLDDGHMGYFLLPL